MFPSHTPTRSIQGNSRVEIGHLIYVARRHAQAGTLKDENEL